MCGLAVRRCEPVCGSGVAGTNLRSFRCRLDVCSQRFAQSIDSLRPGQLVHEWRCRQKLSVGAIKHVDEAIAVCLHQQLLRCALVNGIDKDRSFDRVIVEKIMRCELEIPLQFSGIWIERQHTVSVEIIARADAAIEVRCWIAGAPINCIELGIVGAWHPRCSAAMQVEFSGPAFGTELSRTGYRPEPPGQLATH